MSNMSSSYQQQQQRQQPIPKSASYQQAAGMSSNMASSPQYPGSHPGYATGASVLAGPNNSYHSPPMGSPAGGSYGGNQMSHPQQQGYNAQLQQAGRGNVMHSGSMPSGIGGNYGVQTYQSGNRGFEEDGQDMPTDFDALFSGKTRPSIAVTGLGGVHQLPTGKASKILGINDPHNLVYENSGFSRNVHFDISELPDEDPDTLFHNQELLAKKRRETIPNGIPGHHHSYDPHGAESIALFPKKSKSLFVSKSKMNKNARWLEWSEKMRVEAQIKKEEFVKKQEEAAKNKLPAPIVKARKESVKFVNHRFVPVEEETALSKVLSTMEQANTAANNKMLSKEQARDRYTEDQWQKLHEYWEHPLFRKSRPLGFLISLLCMVVAIPPLLSTKWVKYDIVEHLNFTYELYENETFYSEPSLNCSTANINGTCFEEYTETHIEFHGFWFNCTVNVTTFSGINDPECQYLEKSGDFKWQSAVIGLLLFSLAFGFLASVLTTCGICSLSLAKKVYYYHSAGEIFFVCGISSTAALIAYPAVMEGSKATPMHEFGLGYYLGWGMPLCYFISAFCMTLDDMIHSITNDCCLMCRGKKKAARTNHV